MKEKIKKKILYVFGILIFIYALKIVLDKVEIALRNKETILTTGLLFDNNQIIILTILSVLFLFFIYKENLRVIEKDLKRFFGWIIFISISAILVQFLIVWPRLTEIFTLLVLAILFAFFVLKERLEDKTK